MTILEMREKRMKLWESAKAFLDSHRGENDLVSNEDAAVYDKMEDEIVALGKEIDRLERQETLNREIGAMLNTPITSQPTGHKLLAGTASDEYKQAFWNAVRIVKEMFGT